MLRSKKTGLSLVTILSVVAVGLLTSCSAGTPGGGTTITVTKSPTSQFMGTGKVDTKVPDNAVNVSPDAGGSLSVQTTDQQVRCRFDVTKGEDIVTCDVPQAFYTEQFAQDSTWCSSSTAGKVPGFIIGSDATSSQCVDPLFSTPPQQTYVIGEVTTEGQVNAVTSGDHVCKSPDKQKTMTCWNKKSGHGFSISMKKYQTF